MRRKLIGIGLAVVLLFSLTACAQGEDLKLLRTEGKAKIDAYVETLTAADYSIENWAEIERLAISGKAEIDKASTKEDVDNIVNGLGDDAIEI